MALVTQNDYKVIEYIFFKGVTLQSTHAGALPHMSVPSCPCFHPDFSVHIAVASGITHLGTVHIPQHLIPN